MDEETRRISRLLARGRVRGPEADEVLERVYEQIDRQKAGETEGAAEAEGKQGAQGVKSARKVRSIRAIGYWGGAALAAAAAVMLLVNVPRGPTETDEVHVPEEGEIGPRPGPGPEKVPVPVPVLRVSCVPGTLEACPVSSEIVFTITGDVGAGGVLSAYAEPVGREGERVFFFSKEDGGVELVVAKEGERSAEGKARFPESLSAGRYRVDAVIADRALARVELIQATGAQAHRVGIRATVSVEVLATR